MEQQTLTLSAELFPSHIWSEMETLPKEDIALLIQLGLSMKDSISVPSSIQPVQEFTPVKLGEIGEDYVFDVLSSVYDVENVSKKGHRGDIFATRKLIPTRCSHLKKALSGKLLVEVKNYSSTVPTHEIDKFISDLEQNSHISGGLFVSLKSGIAGIGKDFLVENVFLGRSLPIIYISSVCNTPQSKEIILLAAEIIWACIDSQSLSGEEVDKMNSQIEKIYDKTSKLSDLLGGLGRTRKSVDAARSLLNKSLQRIYNEIFSVETQIGNNIQSIQKIVGRLTEYEFDSQQGNKLAGNSSDIIPVMFECVAKKVSDAKINKHSISQEIVKNILKMYIPAEDWIEIIVDKKTTIWNTISEKKKCIVVLELLKTKTNVRLNITARTSSDGTIEIPNNIEYSEGWMIFTIDANFISNVFPKLDRILTG